MNFGLDYNRIKYLQLLLDVSPNVEFLPETMFGRNTCCLINKLLCDGLGWAKNSYRLYIDLCTTLRYATSSALSGHNTPTYM